MLTNYHTHTVRCNHASGTEKDYVDAAIQAGMHTLGFSDHAPYLFHGDYYSTYRMCPEETAEYMNNIRALSEAHASEIRLLAGFEIEYYPSLFARTVRFLGDLDCDYLILGQHFVGDEEVYSGRPTNAQTFDRYINQIIEGLETGLFTYLCHPDLCCCIEDAHLQEKGYLKLCEAAKRMDIPLEFNMYGMVDHRHYPSDEFYKIAAAVGNVIVPGRDAHEPERLGNLQEVETMHAFAKRCGFQLTELTAEQVLERKNRIL